MASGDNRQSTWIFRISCRGPGGVIFPSCPPFFSHPLDHTDAYEGRRGPYVIAVILNLPGSHGDWHDDDDIRIDEIIFRRGHDDRWEDTREREKDCREAEREWVKDQREAAREWEKDRREHEREMARDMHEYERERDKAAREYYREEEKRFRANIRPIAL